MKEEIGALSVFEIRITRMFIVAPYSGSVLIRVRIFTVTQALWISNSLLKPKSIRNGTFKV